MSRGWWVWGMGFGLVLATSVARGTVIVPMSDEDLVATSDLVVVGTVERVASVLLGTNRVMTRVTIAVEQAVKGDPGGPSVVVTDAGGDVAGIRSVVFGAPSYAQGERALVFLRARRDGSLTTNSLALGKYAILAARDGVPIARRAGPTVDARPLATLVARVGELARAGTGARTDGRSGIGIEPPTFLSEAFTLSTDDAGIGARWFEADCGLPITFDRAGADPAFDDGVSASALAAGTAAWTGAPDASITLLAGSVVPAAPSGVGGTLDGDNVVMFGDPFGDVPNLANCTGVLAIGGVFSASSTEISELQRIVNGTIFGKAFEGDVVLNPEVGMCLADAVGLAEVVGHELGHAIGFGHSSENPAETDPVKLDALMYFSAHDDGRGARLGQDDIDAADFAYPASLLPATPVAEAACEVALGLLTVDCTGSISTVPFRKMRKAVQAARQAAGAGAPGKQKKLLRKTLRLLGATDKAVGRLVTGTCAQGMHDHIARYRQQVGALLATL
ncbi:MAG TPA: hypothetical protein VMS22_01700 [Candidatus Eisenbacteria bacterium]|nr:hypothetical protein [Candidatus Eisenbacteria bacterium]